MYEDYKGSVIIDTVDQITTFEKFAERLNIDINRYEVLRIEIRGNREDLSSHLICKNKVTEETKEFAIEPFDKPFKEFFKRTKITIENK